MEKSDVVPAPRIKTLHLFAGAGGGILADLLLGHQPIGAVEVEAYPRKVLLQRQLDGCLPEFPIWDDVRTFRSDNPDTSAYIDRLRGIRSELAICGGFPCQDISAAGKGAGITGERSGLWNEMARIISEIRPRYIFVENSPMLVSRGLHVVLSEIAAMGYDAKWGVVGAHHARAPHKRDRIWIVADSKSTCGQQQTDQTNPGATEWQGGNGFERSRSAVGHAMCATGQRISRSISGTETPECGAWQFDGHQPDGFKYAGKAGESEWWKSEPDVDRVAHGVASRVDRLKCIGNGQVPRVAEIAWSIFDTN